MRRACVLLLALPWAVPAAAERPVVSREAYRAALASIAAELHRGDVEAARAEARALSAEAVDWQGTVLDPDASVLDPVVSLRGGRGGGAAAATRVDALVRALDDALPPDAATADPELLGRLRAQQQPDEIPAGGEVATLGPSEGLPESWSDRVVAAYERVRAALARLLDWLARLWPVLSEGEAQHGAVPTRTVIAMVALVLAALVVLAVRAVRRGTRGAPEPASESLLASSRDDDPLSRESDQWEEHAERLAAAGRFREAIRAWYHAVLVALFRAGVLHHERGRTNWEYASRIPPEARWRPEFLEATRRFEREWYGRAKSGEEELRDCAERSRGILRALRGRESAA